MVENEKSNRKGNKIEVELLKSENEFRPFFNF